MFRTIEKFFRFLSKKKEKETLLRYSFFIFVIVSFQFLSARTIASAAINPKYSRYPNVESGDKEICGMEIEREKELDKRYSVSMCVGLKRYEISSDDIIAWENRTEDLRSVVIKADIECLEKTYDILSNGMAIIGTHNSILSDYEKRMILIAEGKLNADRNEGSDNKVENNDTQGKPSNEQLQRIHENLSAVVRLLKFSFFSSTSFRICSKTSSKIRRFGSQIIFHRLFYSCRYSLRNR